jgi:hypothetical protein
MMISFFRHGRATRPSTTVLHEAENLHEAKNLHEDKTGMPGTRPGMTR